jgi:hypothetical protein
VSMARRGEPAKALVEAVLCNVVVLEPVEAPSIADVDKGLDRRFCVIVAEGLLPRSVLTGVIYTVMGKDSRLPKETLIEAFSVL